MPKVPVEDITKKSVRAKLLPKPGNAPYFRRIREGCSVGFRPSTVATGTGTWVARYRTENGKHKTTKLGEFDEWDDALRAAEKFFTSAQRNVYNTHKVTVTETCKRYITKLQGEHRQDAAKDAEARFRRTVDGTDFGNTKLALLRPEHVREWFAGLLKIRLAAGADTEAAKQSCNRNLASIKAALNLALADKLVGDDHAWSNVKPHKGVNRQRENAYLSRNDRKRLWDIGCSYTYENADGTRFTKDRYIGPRQDLRKFICFLAVSGLRPGAAAALRAKDWDGRTLTVPYDKAGAGRRFVASKRVRRILNLFCNGLAPDDHIFTRAGKTSRTDTQATERKPFDKDYWTSAFERAAERAGVKCTLYALRHSAITDMVADGIPIAAIAYRVGTSISMIEKHYGHLGDKTFEELDAIQY